MPIPAPPPSPHDEPTEIILPEEVDGLAEPVAPADPGNPYRSPAAPPAQPLRGDGGGDDDAVATIIPYKNAAALTSYYLGVFGVAFGCIPLLGLILPVVAIVLGVKGLKYRKAHPQAHGSAHAWVGIACGTLVLVAWCVGLVAVVVAMVVNGPPR